jgi:glycerophosphoryl diester phosphodiesterase
MIEAFSPFSLRSLCLVFFVSLVGVQAMAGNAASIRRKLLNPNDGVIVVAHRGCHNAYPAKNISSAPENSLKGLKNCVALGVDVMEFDIHRTKDGALVVMHDATVDRTTNGSGRIENMTLTEFRYLQLRDNFGGAMAPQLTDLTPPTLREVLDAAKGRIMLNLDVKEDIYEETLAEVVAAGMADQVLVKRVVGTEADNPLADQAPYSQALFMPILWEQGGAPQPPDFAAIIRKQASASHRIPSVELVYFRSSDVPSVREAAHAAHVRLWANTLTQVGVKSVVDYGGDLDGLRDPDLTWSRLHREGFSIFQTDEPGPLIAWLKRKGLR